MGYLIVILIGLVQGVAEFLPISSSGHLSVLYDIFDVTDNTILLSIIMHLATLLAVVIVYYEDIVLLLKNPFCRTNKLLVVSTIPTVIIVLIFEVLFGGVFGGSIVIIGFLITAIILLISEKINKNTTSIASDILDMNISYKSAVLIGLTQGIATIPGISRSGSTIATALMCKVNKSDATKFSFLMSIPIIVASFCYELLKIKEATFDFGTMELFVGFVVAFFSGLFAIKYMINFIKNKKLYIFSIYLVILSTILIICKYLLQLW